jgi:hypothetical protein
MMTAPSPAAVVTVHAFHATCLESYELLAVALSVTAKAGMDDGSSGAGAEEVKDVVKTEANDVKATAEATTVDYDGTGAAVAAAADANANAADAADAAAVAGSTSLTPSPLSPLTPSLTSLNLSPPSPPPPPMALLASAAAFALLRAAAAEEVVSGEPAAADSAARVWMEVRERMLWCAQAGKTERRRVPTMTQPAPRKEEEDEDNSPPTVGLCTLNQVDP